MGARKITVTCSRSEHPTDRTPVAKIDSSISFCSSLRVMSLLSQGFYFSKKKTTSKMHLVYALQEAQESSDETHLY